MARSRGDQRAARLADLERQLRDAIDAPPPEDPAGFTVAPPPPLTSHRRDRGTAILLALVTVGIVGAVPLLDAVRTMGTPRPTGAVAGAVTSQTSVPATPSSGASSVAPSGPAAGETGRVGPTAPAIPTGTPGGAVSPGPGPGASPSPTGEIASVTSPPRATESPVIAPDSSTATPEATPAAADPTASPAVTPRPRPRPRPRPSATPGPTPPPVSVSTP